MSGLKRERDYLFAFLLAPVFAVVIIFYLMLDATEAEFSAINKTALNTGIIERFAESSKTTDISAVMMGNSRLRYATSFGFRPEDIVTLPDGGTLSVLQFASNAAEFKAYKAYTDRILLTRPDYIIVMDMLLSNGRPPDIPLAAQYAKLVYESWSTRLRNEAPESVWESNRTDRTLGCHDKYTAGMLSERLRLVAARDRHNLDPSENQSVELVRAFIQKAEAQGSKVVIVHIPPNRDVLDEFQVPHYFLNGYGLGKTPNKEDYLPALHDDVTWLSYPEERGRRHYCDLIHLNEQGRTLFSAWLRDKIQNL